MKAPFLKVVSIAAFWLLLPGVAFAKGPGLQHVTLDGPGIGHPIQIEKRYPYLLDDAISLHLFGSTSTRNVARERPRRTDLGPRFQLTYHMTWGKPVEIDLYPYTDQGPVAYAAPGQAVPIPIGYSGEDYEFPVHAGWYDYRPALVDLLQESGLPTKGEIDGGAWGLASFLVVAALVIGPAVAVVALSGRRRHRDALAINQLD
jgi:hypothetical protein